MQTSVDYKILYEQQLKITADLTYKLEALTHQMQRFQRAGVTIAQSTMNSVTTRTLNSLFSLYEAHKKIVLESKYLHVDETGIRVMDETKKARPNGSSGRGTTHQGNVI